MNRKHLELPGQLALDGLDPPPATVESAARPSRRDGEVSIAFSRCPYGNHGRLTGVLYRDCRLVFRDHLIRFASGAALVCRGSGQPVPDRHDVHEG